MAYADCWTIAAAGTMNVARLRERKLYVVQVEVFGEGTTVWWSLDGTSTGLSVFTISTSLCPWFEVMMMADGSNNRFSDVGHWGPMFTSGESLSQGQFMWSSSYDASATLWKTQIWFGGADPASNQVQAGGSGRTAFVYALGA